MYMRKDVYELGSKRQTRVMNGVPNQIRSSITLIQLPETMQNPLCSFKPYSPCLSPGVSLHRYIHSNGGTYAFTIPTCTFRNNTKHETRTTRQTAPIHAHKRRLIYCSYTAHICFHIILI